MEVILIMLVLVLIVFMAICWVQSDMIRELEEKNERATKEIIMLQQEEREQEIRADELASKLYYGQDIPCYSCSNQGCGNGCRYTVGAKGCKKYRRQE